MVSRPSPARPHSSIRNALGGPSTSARKTRRGVRGRPSRSRAAAMMKKRAKWTFGNMPKGMSELFGASWPAAARSVPSCSSWPGRISAITGTDDCVVTIGVGTAALCADGRARGGELEDEVDRLGAADVYDAQVRARAYFADLVADRPGNERRL